MSGVRLASRVARKDFARCLVVVTALAVAAGFGGFPGEIRGAANSPGTDDPFLTEDTTPPAADEIPALPDEDVKSSAGARRTGTAKSKGNRPARKSAENETPAADRQATADVEELTEPKKLQTPQNPEPMPTLKAPRINRNIRQSAAPKQETEADLADVPELTNTPRSRPKISSLKNTPTSEKPGWKPVDGTSAEPPAGAVGTAEGTATSKNPKLDGPLAERARLERGPQLDDTREPLSAIVIEGNKSKKTDEIMKLIKSRVGRPFDPKVTKEDVASLHATRWFFDVEPRIAQSKEGPVLVFRVREKPILEKITFQGNKKIKEKELKELVEQCSLKVGGGYDMGQNREALHRILANYREKGYRHATVELEKGNSPEDREVVFQIVEGPKVVVSKIAFSGNKYFSSPVLKTQIKTKTQILWLFGGKYDPASIQEDLTSLRQYYTELGFFDVQIRHEEEVSEDKSKVTFKYVIEEGQRYKVRDIVFIGNHVIPTEKLRENMKVQPGQHWAERFIVVDKEKMITQYGELGRIFATVERRARSYEEPGYVDLIYEIKEDRPYRIGRINVHIAGEHPHTRENAVLTKLTFRPGELASKAKIEKSKQRLRNSQIFAGGRPGAQAGPGGGAPPEIALKPSEFKSSPRSDLNLARGQSEVRETSAGTPTQAPAKAPAVLPAKASAAPRSTTSTTSRSIRSVPSAADTAEETELEPVPGFEIVRGQSPGLYDSLPDADPQDSPPGDFGPPPEEPFGWLDTDVYVGETQTGRINLGVSFNSNAGLLGNVMLEENNFDLFKPPASFQEIVDGVAWRGGGQQFRVEAMPGVNLSRYLISWRDPYFLEQNISLGVSGSYYTRVFPNWWEQRAGGRVTLGHQFTPNTSASVTLRGENVDIQNPSVPTPYEIYSVLGNNFLSTVKATLVHDTRDNAFLPGSGHYLQFDYEQGFGNFVYPKFDVEAKQYFLVRERPDGGNRHVVSVVGQFGWIGDQAPFFERYFAGGFASFRGFRFYGVSPQVNGIVVGGQFQALGTVEYLLPITADNTFQIVAFTDFGTVDSTVTLDKYRQTVGAGFRLSVPMMGPMPIAIDFAVPVLEQPNDIRQFVSFTMGLLK